MDAMILLESVKLEEMFLQEMEKMNRDGLLDYMENMLIYLLLELDIMEKVINSFINGLKMTK